MNKNDLQTMYGATPDSFTRRVAFALKKTEEKPMKHTMRTVLIAAAIIVLLTAAAYAVFSSQVAELFGTMYGDDTKSWLEEGSVATTDQTYTLGDIVYTLDEVVYRNNGLYGVGTIRAKEGSDVVIMMNDQLLSDPYGYDIHGGIGRPETAPEGTKTVADVAKEKGGKVLLACIRLSKIGVDGGELLEPGSAGYSWAQQRDGSFLYTFEVSDGVVVDEGTTYQIEMHSYFFDTDADGNLIQDTKQVGDWLVTIQPEPISEQTGEPAADTETPAQTIGDVELIVPEEYTETGTLPVYNAITRDFGENLQPELFNQSGVAQTDGTLIIFNDEAQLNWSPETLFYGEYKGTYNGNYRKPEREPMILALKTLSNAASDLAGHAYNNWPDEGACWEGVTLEKTTLAGITLDSAKAKLEALLETLNVEGYTCDYALDMDIERIRSMGETWNRILEENQWNSAVLDYSLAAEENEGFYLHYTNGVKSDGNRFDIYAYVTQKGIAYLQLRDLYIRGDVVSTPETLVSPESVMAALPVEMTDSRFSDMTLDHIVSIELTYAPARAADKTDGMVFTPAWYVIYRDNEGAEYDYDSYAIFNAVDGAMLYAMFQ
ncbi:MAG: DUF4179 domain-containing protein [Clostridiales bacterium]|nr:DUF4179 domain-containing protein [Clostridiales bacterium]